MRWRAREQANRIAYTYLIDGEKQERNISYSELDRQARVIGAELQHRGIIEGDRVLIVYPPGLDYIAAFFGCLYAGAIAVPAYPPRNNQHKNRIYRLIQDCNPKVALTTKGLSKTLTKRFEELNGSQSISIISTDSDESYGRNGWKVPELSLDSIAFIQYTSGSTSDPKGVLLTHRNLLSNLSLIHDSFSTTKCDVGVSWLPPYHDMGLIGGILQPLYTGFHMVLMAPVAFIEKPVRWLEAISNYKATVSGGPNFAFELCTEKINSENIKNLDLSSWKVAFSGAEPIRENTLQKFHKKYEGRGFSINAFYPCYGLAESTLLVSGGKRGASFKSLTIDKNMMKQNRVEVVTDQDHQVKLVSSGRSLPNHKIKIVDPDKGIECSNKEIGEIWVSGSSIAQGYWGREGQSKQTFSARIINGDEPYLRTGDLGFIKDGELFVTGRKKDLIIIRGRNYYPQDIELTVGKSHPDLHIDHGAAFSVDENGKEKLVIVQELKRRYSKDKLHQIEKDIRKAITEEHQLLVDDIVLIRYYSIPKTSSGKIQRYVCKSQYLSNKLNVIYSSDKAKGNKDLALKREQEDEPKNRTESRLRLMIADIMNITPGEISLNESFLSMGLDSISMIQLRSMIEREFKQNISEESIFNGAIKSIASQIDLRLGTAKNVNEINRSTDNTSKQESLSSAQQRIWLLENLNNNKIAYNIPIVFRLEGALNLESFLDSLNECILEHESLRTVFPIKDNVPVRKVLKNVKLDISIIDLYDYPENVKEEKAMLHAVEEAKKPFDLSKGPLIRISAIKLKNNEFVIIMIVHHIVADGWSMGLLGRELSLRYKNKIKSLNLPLPESEVNYEDYIVYEKQHKNKIFDEQIKYWKEKLKGAPPILELPTDRNRPVVQTYRGSQKFFALSKEQLERLESFSREENVTLFMTLFSAYVTLLYRYSKQTDIVVGTPVAGRNHPQLADMIGLLINTLPIRVDMVDDPTFQEVLKRVRQVALEAFAHQDLPFEKLVEELAPRRDSSYSPIFQVMFVFQEDYMEKLDLPDVRSSFVDISNETAKFDLSLYFIRSKDGLKGTLEYSTDLYDDETAQNMVQHLNQLIQGIINKPNEKVSELPLLTEREQKQLLVEWNDTSHKYSENKSITEFFEYQALQTPNQVALRYDHESWTYQEVNEKANRLAHYLQKRGVGPEKIVGIFMDRTPDMIISLLAILKAGGAYLPLDPKYPKERTVFSLKDSAAVLVLSHGELHKKLPIGEIELICIDCIQDSVSQESIDKPKVDFNQNHLAYTIYTSGSTGKPKAVAIEHKSVVAFLHWAKRTFSKNELSGVLASTSICFDLSVFEIFVPLSWGGTVILCENGLQLPHLPAAQEVKLLNTVPSVAQELMRVDGIPSSVRTINLAGEPLSSKLVHQLYSDTSVQKVYNLYGPSEDTTYSTFTWVKYGAKRITIGRPLENEEIYILDTKLQPVPVGVFGELYIGGKGVARGYLNRPDLTAEQFIPSPFGEEAGSRLYKTGDVARYLPDGNIEYSGRMDHQVKIRGFRIELGEIENRLQEHPAIHEGVVDIREIREEDKQIVAFVTINPGYSLNKQELRRHLSMELPSFMIPNEIIELENIPLTSNGKVDRRTLQNLEVGVQEKVEKIAPVTLTEQRLEKIWSQVLGIKKVGINENFFDLGGHSLLATKIMSRINGIYNFYIPFHIFFQRPTIKELARYIDEVKNEAPTDELKIEEIEIITVNEAPLSFAQQRLWFLHQLDPGSSAYNMYGEIRLEGALNVPILERAFNEVMRRHESLRTRFLERNGQPVQVVDAYRWMDIPCVSLDTDDKEKRLQEIRKNETEHQFNLAQGPLLKTKLVRMDADYHVLMFTIHHIVFDDWSLEILIRELAAIYKQLLNNEEISLRELQVQYKDFAHWQIEKQHKNKIFDEQIKYWKEKLKGAPPILELPTDRNRPVVQTYRGSQKFFALSKEQLERLESFSREENVTLFMTLFSAYVTLLYRYSKQTDIVVGTPVAGRNHPQLADMIGLLINTLPIRVDMVDDPTFQEVLKRVRQVALEAFAHQDLPFEKLVEELAPRRDSSYSPIFQVMFVFQEDYMEKLDLPDVRSSFVDISNETAKFDLSLYFIRSKDGLKGTLEYSTDLYDDETAQNMVQHLNQLIQGIINKPNEKVSELPLLTEREQKQLLVEWNDTSHKYSENKSITEFFEYQALQTPNQVALRYDHESWTYQEVNEKANRLAHYLQKRGVGPEKIVGIFMDRTPDMIISLLAILKAGGAYLPLDPKYPKERTVFSLKDSAAVLVLSHGELHKKLPIGEIELICIDCIQDSVSQESIDKPKVDFNQNHLAYTIYTSGSTGKPKAVAIEHKSVVAFLHWAKRTFSKNELSGVLASTSICFDLSVFEIFVPLSWGGTVILCENGLQLPHLPAAQEVKLLNTVPSVAQELMRVDGIPSSVRTINLAGEPLSSKLVHQLYSDTSVQKVYNLYGPSEDTTYSTFTWVKYGAKRITIGRPLENEEIYILDTKLQPVPVGVFGELYIGGKGVARGYLNRPDLTAEQFIPSPFGEEAGSRLYKTGDVARYLPDGNIEYSGRMDHQVKIRGFRIELGEIENRLQEHPAIHEGVVDIREIREEDKQIVAFVTINPGYSLNKQELRRHLSMELPSFMIPNEIIELENIPLTSNGKVDRRTLQNLEVGVQEKVEKIAPVTLTEQRLEKIWSQVLGIKKVGINENFFDLGGHSLLATKIMSRINGIYNFYIPFHIFFQRPTIKELARYIDEVKNEAPTDELKIEEIEIITVNEAPLSFAQQRLWFLHQLDPGSSAYNMYGEIRLEGALNVPILERAFNEVMRRHESLRTRFLERNGQPVQVVDAYRWMDIPCVSLDTDDKEKRLQEIRKNETEHQFNLAQGPLLKTKLVRMDADYHVLMFTIHHIVFDGWSIEILIRELTTLYKQLLNNEEVSLRELQIQYKDFAHWQIKKAKGEEFNRQLSYWKNKLGENPTVVKLPTDNVRNVDVPHNGRVHELKIPNKIVTRLKSLSQRENSTLYMTLLASFQILLYRYTNVDEILVGSPIANRNSPEIEPLIGCFINTLVLKADFSEVVTFKEVLSQVRQNSLEAYENQDLPFEMLVESVQPKRNVDTSPLFQVLFTFLNEPMPPITLPGVSATLVEVQDRSAKFDLTLSIKETKKYLSCQFNYNPNLLKELSRG